MAVIKSAVDPAVNDPMSSQIRWIRRMIVRPTQCVLGMLRVARDLGYGREAGNLIRVIDSLGINFKVEKSLQCPCLSGNACGTGRMIKTEHVMPIPDFENMLIAFALSSISAT